MARYRIVKVPQIESDPIFRIECRGKIYSRDFFGFITSKEGWVDISPRGSSIIISLLHPNVQEHVPSFKTYELAKDKLDSILEYAPKQNEVVFDTLTANPPTDTGT